MLCPEYFHKQIAKNFQIQVSHKKPSYFALYGLFNGDPYNL